MAIAELSIVPIGTATTSVSKHVAAITRKLEELAVPYELNAMGTVIEGDVKALLEIVGQLHEIPFEAGAGRVYTTLKIDDRRDKQMTAREKVSSVKDKV